jgi:hypothetical protein
MIATVFAGSSVGLAVAIATWGLTAFAGYRIWRTRHPADSARAAIGVRIGAALGFIGTVAATLMVLEFPGLALVIVVAWVVLLVAAVVGVALAERSVTRDERPPTPRRADVSESVDDGMEGSG